MNLKKPFVYFFMVLAVVLIAILAFKVQKSRSFIAEASPIATPVGFEAAPNSIYTAIPYIPINTPIGSPVGSPVPLSSNGSPVYSPVPSTQNSWFPGSPICSPIPSTSYYSTGVPITANLPGTPMISTPVIKIDTPTPVNTPLE